MPEKKAQKKENPKKKPITRAKLAIILSKLKAFESPKIKLEQYVTDSETASTILWDIYTKEDIENKKIADFGAGTGILGLGLLILGAKYVYFVEKDKEIIKTLKENIKSLGISSKRYKVQNISIEDFNKKPDIVIQNPPFGTKQRHSDKIFLEKALLTSDTIYTIHKTSTKKFIISLAKSKGFDVLSIDDYIMPIKSTYKFHKKRIERIKISCFRMQKSNIYK